MTAPNTIFHHKNEDPFALSITDYIITKSYGFTTLPTTCGLSIDDYGREGSHADDEEGRELGPEDGEFEDKDEDYGYAPL